MSSKREGFFGAKERETYRTLIASVYELAIGAVGSEQVVFGSLILGLDQLADSDPGCSLAPQLRRLADGLRSHARNTRQSIERLEEQKSRALSLMDLTGKASAFSEDIRRAAGGRTDGD